MLNSMRTILDAKSGLEGPLFVAVLALRSPHCLWIEIILSYRSSNRKMQLQITRRRAGKRRVASGR
jgi:hypothetical protein